MKKYPDIPAHVDKFLEIDLSAISHNYSILAKQLKEGTILAAILKGNAYGLGIQPVITELMHAGCKNFYFSFLAVAIDVRKLFTASDINIYILHGVLPQTEELFDEHNLIPCLISMKQVERWAKYAQKTNKVCDCLLHINTGLNREGITEGELEQLIHDNNYLKNLNILYLMSHLIYTDDKHLSVAQQQLQIIKNCQKKIQTKISFARSIGIVMGQDFHCDMARVGIGLYGYLYSQDNELPLLPCLKLYAQILLIRTVKAGEAIGYEKSYICPKDMKIALLSVGYASGILHKTSTKMYHVFLQGKQCFVVGKISMDTMTIDISHLKDYPSLENQWVEIIGSAESIKNYAEITGTCGHELLVKLTTDYFRIYKNAHIDKIA